MSGSFFKKSLAAGNVRVSTQGGHRTVANDGSMDDEYERRSYGGPGPRVNNRGRGRGPNRGQRGRYQNYNQHDDRGGQSVTERLADRLGYRGRGRDRRGRRGAQQFRGAGAHHGHPGRGGAGGRGGAPSNAPQWYQVTVPYGKKAGKEFIYESINELLDIPFSPVSYREDGQAAVFYVELSFSSVEALKAINKRITLPNNFKMMLVVKQQDPPIPKVLEGDVLAKLTSTMSGLYDTDTKVLDLTALHKNEGLKPECLPLNRRAVFTAIVDVISEHIPELVALNLSSNRLTSLEILERLVGSTPNLVGLDLSNNEFREGELDRIKGWNLKELNLTGTPLAKRLGNDFNSYLSAVRKKFPQIVVLDGNEAPAPIVFELDAVAAQGLPARQCNYLGNSPACSELITKFINQYIEVFDSDNRHHLIAAYDDCVTFSTSFWFYPGMDRQHRFDISSSRNLLRIPPNERNGKRVHYGKEAVVSFFTDEFPKTKHLLETLNVDIIFQNMVMVSFTLSGAYEEPNNTKSHKITRLFSRNFTAVPQGEGIVIISEQLCFTNASSDKRGQMMSAARQRGQVETASTSAAGPSSAPAAPASQLDSAGEQAMLQRFMAESGMNEHWSKECLVANGYSYDGAAAMFTRLKTEGKIPVDAFE